MLDSKQNSPLEKKGISYQIGALITTAAIYASTLMTTFAATDLSSAIKNICNKVGTLLTSVFGPLCILILGIAIITILIGKNSKSAEQGMEWAKRACICFIVFNLLGSILTWGITLFSGTNVSSWGTTTEALIQLL